MPCARPFPLIMKGQDMAQIFLEMKGTRRTAIGNLRFGVIYRLDNRDARVDKVIKALTDKGTKAQPKRPAAVVLSEKDVKARRAATESLIPEPEVVSATDQALRSGADAKKVIADQRKEIAALKKAATTAASEITVLTEGKATALARVAELEASMADLSTASDAAMADAAARIAELEAAAGTPSDETKD